ncbi:Myb/SANT-like domain-containing protein [Plasmodiophora brassicae]
MDGAAPAPKRKRGRPRKSDVQLGEPRAPLVNAGDHVDGAAPKRKRGRPRKSDSLPGGVLSWSPAMVDALLSAMETYRHLRLGGEVRSDARQADVNWDGVSRSFAKATSLSVPVQTLKAKYQELSAQYRGIQAEDDASGDTVSKPAYWDAMVAHFGGEARDVAVDDDARAETVSEGRATPSSPQRATSSASAVDDAAVLALSQIGTDVKEGLVALGRQLRAGLGHSSADADRGDNRTDALLTEILRQTQDTNRLLQLLIDGASRVG